MLTGSLFTTGSINKNSAISYHHDRGNLRGAWSAMLVVRRAVTGGDLVLPEYGCVLRLRDGDALLFDGQSTLHGVTPLSVSPGGYRYTLVYYTLEQIWRCLAPLAELERIQSARRKKRAPS